jgi:hypothetical protein
MALNLLHLDDRTRTLMVEEIEADLAAGRLYLSPRLSPSGQTNYAALLKQAAEAHDEEWLAAQLRNGHIATHEARRTPSGKVTNAKVPITAPGTLAEGEFNRFYVRALCMRALADGIRHLVVYRAKPVPSPRPESEARVGQPIDAEALLRDLRTNPGVETALGVPPGPNSGLSVRLP